MNKAKGNVDAPLLIVMTSPPSEKMEAWFWKLLLECGIQKTDTRIICILDEAPRGANNKPLVTQIRSSWDRFKREIKVSTPKTVMAVGSDALYYLTGVDQPIFDARGYVIRKNMFRTIEESVYKQVGTYKNNSKATGAKAGDPKMKFVTESISGLLGGDFNGDVIPVFQLEYVQKMAFAVKPAFKEDVRRIKRSLDGLLKLIDERIEYYCDFDGIVTSEGLSVGGITRLENVSWEGDVLAVDIETHGVDNEVIDRVSFSDGYTTASLEWTKKTLDFINHLFAQPSVLFTFHNSQFDVPRLQAAGVNIRDDTLNTRVFDTMFGAVTLQPDLHKSLCRAVTIYLDCEPWKGTRGSQWYELSQLDPIFYSAKDAFMTAWLARQEIGVMKKLGVWNLFMGQGGHPGPGTMAVIPELTEMSAGGIKTNREYAEWWMPKLERRQLAYEKMWAKMFPLLDPHSTKKLADFFYGEWGLPVQRNKEDSVSTDELSLITLRYYIESDYARDYGSGRWKDDTRCVPRTFDLLLKLRDVSKTLSTYVQPITLGESKWVHPQYLPISKDDEMGSNKTMKSKGNTSTGRLAAYGINLLNQPKKVRKLFVPDTEDMCFIQGDYKSAELYIMAYSARDKRLIEDLKHDMHQRNAERFGISRDIAKNVTYARQYLAGPPKVSKMILKDEHIFVPIAECKRIMDGLSEYYWETEAYKRHLITLCETKKYIKNPFGRIRFFHAGDAPAAVNFWPQSCVADCILCVLKDVAILARSLGGRLTTSIYDSMLIQVPNGNKLEAARGLKKIMERKFDCIAPGFSLPVEIEMGEAGATWGDLKKGSL